MRCILRTAIAMTLTVVLACSQASADWDPGECAKWVQLPDLTTTGMDIFTDLGDTNPGWQSMIQDDFQCTSTDPITDIHFWGSWLDDINTGSFAGIQVLLIDMRVPAFCWFGTWGDQTNAPWTQAIVGLPPQPMSLSERVYYTLPEGDEEIFWDARAGQQIGTDTVVYQYNIDIDEEDAYVQQGTPQTPVTYGLEILVKPAVAGEKFGWKTRDPLDGHFGNDARYKNAGGTPLWPNLVYPTGHPYEGQSADMAFVITPEPATIVIMALGISGLLLRRKAKY